MAASISGVQRGSRLSLCWGDITSDSFNISACTGVDPVGTQREVGHRLEKLEADRQAGEVRLCFGSKKLFHAQFDLEANGYENHVQWKED